MGLHGWLGKVGGLLHDDEVVGGIVEDWRGRARWVGGAGWMARRWGRVYVDRM